MKMRKIIISALLFVLIVTALTFTASADEGKITLSEDYRTLEYNGETYTCFNLYQTSVWMSDPQSLDVELEIAGDDGDVVDYSVYLVGSIINVDLNFEENFYTIFYISDAEREAFLNFEKNGSENIYVLTDFGDVISIAKSDLMGEKTVMKSSEYIRYFGNSVYAVSDCGGLEKCVGEYICTEDAVYYLDYSELSASANDFFALDYDSLPIWRVTDEDTVSKLSAETQGEKLDSEILVVLTAVIFVFVFGILPGVVIIVGGILLSKAKGLYRKLLTAIVALGILALLSFIVMAVCFVGVI